MALDIAFGQVAISAGSVDKEAVDASERAMALADQRQDGASLIRATWVLWNVHISYGRVIPARENAIRLSDLAASVGGPFERLVADRAIGVTELLLGNLIAARTAIERVQTTSPGWHVQERLKWYDYDPDITARNTLVTLLWLEGKPESAMAVARENSTRALAPGADNAAPAFLADAAFGPAFIVGDFDAADRYLTLLDALIRRGAPPNYRSWVGIARAGLAANRGDVARALALLEENFDPAIVHPRWLSILVELAEQFGAAGEVERARRLADWLLARVEGTGEHWVVSEVQRVRAQLSDDDDQARLLLELALGTARRQGAKAWELRAATSLARRWPRIGRPLLAPLLDSFTEGHGARDLIAARQVLAA